MRLAAGLLRSDPSLYVRLVAIYSLPSAVAATLELFLPLQLLGRWLVLGGLDFVTASVAPVVAMVAVAATFYGRHPSLFRLTSLSLPWLPRYLWTNAHTSLVFWGPILVSLQVQGWLAQQLQPGAVSMILAAVAWVAIGALAVYLHARTLLAPYLAVHGDLPATVAAVESWRLTGGAMLLTIRTFLLSAIPLGLPLAGILGALLIVSSLDGSVGGPIRIVLPHLIWMAIQITRPLVVAAAFLLYRDLWDEEQRKRRGASVPLPPLTRLIPSLTAWVPRLGRQPLTTELF